MFKEEARIKRKIQKMVKKMLKCMTLEHAMQSGDTILFTMRKLPPCKWEKFVDEMLAVMQGEEK